MSLRAFFAYPSIDRVSDAITAFCEKVSHEQSVTFFPWEKMRIGGKILISTICQEIDKSDVFCADITKLNPNVIFELGYAIMKNKRIWLIRDSSFTSDDKDFRQLKILTNLGYRSYVNSYDIVTAYYQDMPHEQLDETIYSQLVDPLVDAPSTSHVLYMKSHYDNEAGIKITQYIGDDAKRKNLKVIVDDPREAAIQPLAWYIQTILSADAVVCHLTAQGRADSMIQNAKHSLVAGMAYGLKIPLLLLTEDDDLGPTDYRDLLYFYKRSRDAVERVKSFIDPFLQNANSVIRSQLEQRTRSREVEELAHLEIGQPIAEHEEGKMADSCFVTTAAFNAAYTARNNIFVGRKGVGKTANFNRLARAFSEDRRIVVCEISPASYELEGIVAIARKFEKVSKRGFLFESLWKFLIYSEIAKVVVSEIESRVAGILDENERNLVILLDQNAEILRLDFSARLDRLSTQLLNVAIKHDNGVATELSISEILHSGILKRLMDAVFAATHKKSRIAVLIDNLDRAWDRKEDSLFLAQFFLGLLNTARKCCDEVKSRTQYRRPSGMEMTLCIFVRADVFEIILKEAPEPDKMQPHRITWDDREALQSVLNSRLVAASGAAEAPVADLWSRYFCRNIGNESLLDFIFGVVLMRPRDLIFIVRSAISAAVDRRSHKVEEIDVKKAEASYSSFAYNSLIVETRERFPNIEEFLYSCMGRGAVYSEGDLEAIATESGQVNFSEFLAALCMCSFLEINVPNRGYFAPAEEKDFDRYYRAAGNLERTGGTPKKFRIHRAFWDVLLISDQPAVV